MHTLHAKRIGLKRVINLGEYGLVLKRTSDSNLSCDKTPLDDICGVYLVGFTRDAEDEHDIPIYAEDKLKHKLYNISYSLVNKNGGTRMNFHSPIAIRLYNNKWLGFMVKQELIYSNEVIEHSVYMINELPDTKIIIEGEK